MKTAQSFFEQIGCVQHFSPLTLFLTASQVSLRYGLNSQSSLGSIFDVKLGNC